MQMRNYAQWVEVCVFVIFLGSACTTDSPLNEPIISPTQITLPDHSTDETIPVTPSPTIVETAGASTPMPTYEIGLAETVVLYTAVEYVSENSTTTATDPNAPSIAYWALKSWPPLPIFDQPIFDTFYGEVAKAPEIAPYFLNFRPQQSPNGRYLLLPGIGGYTPPSDELGTGLWLVDMLEDTVYQLLPQAKIATWSPASDAITFVEDGTLFILPIAKGANPLPLFSHPDLWELYAHWSPDGRWIAIVTETQQDPDAEGSPELSNTYWLVPTNGESAFELAFKQDFAMEYTTGEMSWSPDSQFLLMRNEVFDLTGEKVGTNFPGRVAWLPTQTQLLANGNDGLRLMTVAGKEIVSIGETFAPAWAFAPGGQQLAYTQSDANNLTSLWIFDLTTWENYFVGSLSADTVFPLRWSSDGKNLIIGGGEGDRSFSWRMGAEPDSTATLILENVILIEVVRNLSH